MSVITKGEYKALPPLPDNVYLARLLSVTEKAPPEKHKDWFPSLSWAFEIVTDPYKKRRAWGKTPTNWVSGKKLDTWLTMLGINAAKGAQIKIEDLKDIPAKILIHNKAYKDPQTGEDKTFTQVTDLLPVDSMDQIKIRELASVPVAVTAVASNTVPPQQVPVVVPANVAQPTYPVVPNTTMPSMTPVVPSIPTYAVPGAAPNVAVGGVLGRTIPF